MPPPGGHRPTMRDGVLGTQPIFRAQLFGDLVPVFPVRHAGVQRQHVFVRHPRRQETRHRKGTAVRLVGGAYLTLDAHAPVPVVTLPAAAERGSWRSRSASSSRSSATVRAPPKT